MSPPPEEEPRITDKAAKLMGIKGSKLERRQSVKSKSSEFQFLISTLISSVLT